MLQKLTMIFVTLSLATVAGAVAPAKVFFVSPKDGETVSKTFKMKFGQAGLDVVPAGKDIDNKKEGHFHVLVDQDSTPEGQVVPSDATHLHYGKAQTEAELTLPPGPHKLTLQFADGAHRSDGKSLSQTISIVVK